MHEVNGIINQPQGGRGGAKPSAADAPATEKLEKRLKSSRCDRSCSGPGTKPFGQARIYLSS
jgi:hypothetical protein